MDERGDNTDDEQDVEDGPIIPRRRILKRSVAACNRCRKRKQKCDGKLPTCSTCATAGTVCVPSERIVLRRDPDCNCAELREQVKNLSSQVTDLTSRLAEERSRAQRHTLDEDRSSLPAIPQSTYRGEALGKSCMTRVLRPTFPRRRTTNVPQDGFLSSPWHLWGSTDEDASLSNQRPHRDTWRTATEAWPRLVDIFFTRRWPQLPVIHKPSFLQRHLIPLSQGQHEDLLSFFQVNIVLAIAAAERTESALDGSLPHQDYFEIAIQNLDAVFAADDIDCIQSLLLLSMYGSHEPQSVNMWYTIGLALRLAVGIDLHRQEAIAGCNTLEAEMRKRIWWSVYVMDRSISIALGRPLGIQDSDITMPFPEPLADDQLTSSSESPAVPNLIPSTNDTSTFIHIIKLRRLYTEAYNTFHSVGQTGARGTEDLEIIRRQHLLQFNEWLVRAPRYLNQTCMFQTSEWFQIAYHQAVMTLHRPSRVMPVNTVDEIRLCIDSSISLISCYSALCAKNKITYTFVALNSLFMAAVTMLHSLRASGIVRQELTKTVAESNIRLCARLLRSISAGRPVGESSALIIERLGQAILNIFDSVSVEDEEVDTEFLLWFGLKSQRLPQPEQLTPSVDLAWNDLLANGFDMNGSMWADLFI